MLIFLTVKWSIISIKISQLLPNLDFVEISETLSPSEKIIVNSFQGAMILTMLKSFKIFIRILSQPTLKG